MSICPKTFRKTLGAFPTGVTVVTLQSPEGTPMGLTISSFTSLSLEPAQILFCLSNTAHSLPLFTPGRYFAVNVLSSHQEALANHFASCGARGVPTDWESLACDIHQDSKCRLLNEAMSHVVSQVETRYIAGDHTIIIGRVIDLIRCEQQEKPLVRHLSSYKGLQPKTDQDYASPTSCKRAT